MDSKFTTIRELIDQMAGRQPEAAFLISPETGRILTFQGLQERARLLSGQLREAGLEKGDKVAFLLDNGLFTAELFLGTMYGGLVSVPLNVRAGVATLSYTLEHCDAKVVFVGEQYAALIKEVMAGVRRAVKVIAASVDGLAGAGAGERVDSSEALAVPAAEDMALLMYTSGSTGQPKAAMHSHRTVLAHGRNSICSHQLTAADRSLLLLPLYHINAECVTLMPALMSGGSVVVPHGFSVSHFWDWLDDYRCTWSAIVPTIISQLLDWKDPRAEGRQGAFQRIRFLRSSSAPLSPSLHREFLDKFKLLLIQAMGSTEAGNIFSNPQPPGANKIGSPGLPWGFETKIVNPEGVEVTAGEPGEVFLRGPALMSGYYKDREGTAAVLSPEGWFRTGDLAYQDADGYFFVVGRSKELIIKGGVNIAPKQIDEVLESHPGVLEAAAVGVPDRYVGEDLVAFVVRRSGKEVEEKELLTFCESRLGHFKTPTRIHFVKDLPKGPSGKVQRLKLQEKAKAGAAAGETEERAGSVAPSTPIEQIIAANWAELLSQAKIDLHDNFFSLGGHSLLAIQSLSKLREKLPVVLSLSDFFENATVAQQAALIRKRLRPDGESTVAWEQELLQKIGAPAAEETIPLRDRSLPCPLSPNQQRIWFMEQLNSGIPVFNESEGVRLRGDLNTEVLEKALNVIIARHEILRTTIQAVAGQPVATVLESWPLRLKQIDLSSLAPERRESEVERLLIDEPRLPYHLETEPGIRATVLRVGAREYVLILMMHHIICDWSSEGVLWRELSALYRAGCGGQEVELPALPIQHGDVAVWQQQQMTKKKLAEDLAYWEENLRGAPALLELPSDRPRPSFNTYKGARQRCRLPAKLVQALRDCSQREKTSLFTLFTAALDTLLYRYTGQEDILLGIPLADRDRPELQSVIGFLLHTHVLRTQLGGDLSFRDLLARVQKGVLGLYAHRAAPFDQVVSKVQPQRNLSYSPLFQVMINWRDRDQQLSFIGMDGLEVESLLAESRTSKFDMILILTDGGDEIWLEMEYSTDLFDDSRIARLFGHYQALLEAVAGDPGRRLGELSLLSEAERQQILVHWNQTQRAFPSDLCVHQLIEEQAERTPEAVAAEFEDRKLTYRELNSQANQCARFLRSMGVGANARVAICTERSLELLVTVLAVLKAGGAYVPLDPSNPQERLAFLLKDAEAQVLISQTSVAQRLPGSLAKVICLDALRETIVQQSSENLATITNPDHLAYVIYTSGSTGQPKGVAMGHKALVNLIEWQCAEPSFAQGRRTLQFAPLGFDVSFQEIFSTWRSGGTLVLVNEELRRDFPALIKFMNERSIERIFLPFVALHHLAETAFRERALPAHLREVITAGEQLQISPPIRSLFEQLNHCTLQNQYGPTESHVVTSFALTGPSAEWAKLPPIGRPIANAQTVILDAEMQPVPIGILGGLYLGGACLARGYLNRPELTAERFIERHLHENLGERWYRTGDVVRYLPDGNIEFLGRSDFQVKIRGFRVEVGEVEAALGTHPAVRQAAVMAWEGRPGNKRLAAYLVLKAEIKVPAGEFKSFLEKKLPEYMVPSAFVLLEKLPLSPNGKVDRKALPSPGTERPELGATYVAPSSPIERTLAEVWAKALGLEKVGMHDNFFDLGGHSLLMAQVQASVCEKLKTKVSIVEMFQYPTISSLARHLSQPSTAPGRLQKIQERSHRRTEALGRQREKKGK